MENNIVLLGEEVKTHNPVKLPMKHLVNHTAVMGMTGSGKTGVIIGLLEQAVAQNVPALIVDIKGDMANILNQDQDFLDKLNVRIITPGATHGDAVDVFAGMDRPDRRQHAVSTLLRLAGEKKADIFSTKNVFLSQILKVNNEKGMLSTLQTLVEDIEDPPFNTINKIPVDEVMPERTRRALKLRLNNILAAPSFEHWHKGIHLDVADLFDNSDPNKTNVTIYSIAHLTDEEQRMFALSYMLDEVLCWMRQQSGTDKLRALLVLDECQGILPPHPANPITKEPIMVMLKQARAFGLGLVLSSQNPKDLDYKAMGNCQTWLVGRLQMKHDRDRVLDAVAASNTVSRKALEDLISRLTPREFIAVRPGSFYKYVSKDCQAQLTGPVNTRELEDLYKQFNRVPTKEERLKLVYGI